MSSLNIHTRSFCSPLLFDLCLTSLSSLLSDDISRYLDNTSSHTEARIILVSLPDVFNLDDSDLNLFQHDKPGSALFSRLSTTLSRPLTGTGSRPNTGESRGSSRPGTGKNDKDDKKNSSRPGSRGGKPPRPGTPTPAGRAKLGKKGGKKNKIDNSNSKNLTVFKNNREWKNILSYIELTAALPKINRAEAAKKKKTRRLLELDLPTSPEIELLLTQSALLATLRPLLTTNFFTCFLMSLPFQELGLVKETAPLFKLLRTLAWRVRPNTITANVAVSSLRSQITQLSRAVAALPLISSMTPEQRTAADDLEKEREAYKLAKINEEMERLAALEQEKIRKQQEQEEKANPKKKGGKGGKKSSKSSAKSSRRGSKSTTKPAEKEPEKEKEVEKKKEKEGAEATSPADPESNNPEGAPTASGDSAQSPEGEHKEKVAENETNDDSKDSKTTPDEEAKQAATTGATGDTEETKQIKKIQDKYFPPSPDELRHQLAEKTHDLAFWKTAMWSARVKAANQAMFNRFELLKERNKMHVLLPSELPIHAHPHAHGLAQVLDDYMANLKEMEALSARVEVIE